MNEDQVNKLVETGATTAVTVLTRFLGDNQRFRGVKFLVSDADKVALREYLTEWAQQRRMAD